MVTTEKIQHPNCAGNTSGRNMFIVCLCVCELKLKKIVLGHYPVVGQPSTSMWDVPIGYRKQGGNVL